MAVSLGTNAHIEWGGSTAYGGSQSFTAAFTIRTGASLGGTRIFGQWGNDGVFDQVFLAQRNGNNFELWICGGAFQQYAFGTNDNPISLNSLHRVVCRVQRSPKLIQIWVNGVLRSTVDAYTGGSGGATPPGLNTANQAPTFAGYELDESVTGMIGEYCELATWTHYVPDWVCEAYGIGMSPKLYGHGIVFHAPMYDISPSGLVDVVRASNASLYTGTNTSGTTVEHPPMYRPDAIMSGKGVPPEPPPTPSNTRSFALHDPINASPFLDAHAGRKEGRLTSIGSIIRRSTDRLGGWQASTCRWSSDDSDRMLRGLQRSHKWYGREFRVYLGDRLDLANSRCLGRFNIREYPPTAGLGVDVEGTDVIGSEFSAFNLDRDILDGYVFDAARFPTAPEDLLKRSPPQPVPAYWGRWSDEPSISAGTVPILAGVVRRGSWPPTEPGSAFRVGFGEMALVNPGGVAPLPPTSSSAAVLAGGNINPANYIHANFYWHVWGRTAGLEGDPHPFYPEQVSPVHVGAAGSKIRISWTFAGTNPDTWRIAIANSYYGARWTQYIEVPGAARSVEFDNCPGNSGGGSGTPSGGLATGALAPTFWGRKEFTVQAVLSDGVTGTANPAGIIPYGGPYKRPAYVSWIPVPGAISYNVIFGDVPVPYFGWTRILNVSADQIDDDGFAYYVYNWDLAGEAMDSIPAPRGLIPVWDTGDVSFGGGTYAQLVISRYPMHKILSVFAGETRLADNHADLRHPDHPSWPLVERFVTIGGWDTTILYVRVGSAVLTAHRDGTAEIRVNACTTEDIGNGRGSTITNAARVSQHIMQELALNDHQTGVWAGIPLFADGVPIINSLSFVNAELMQIQRIGGAGYTARVAIDKPTTLRVVIQNIVQSFGLHMGINQHGQIVAGHYDDSVDPTADYPHYTDIREIVGNIRIDPRTRELENEIPYQWDYRPETGNYDKVNLVARNEASVTDHRGKTLKGQQRSLPYAADLTTVQDVITRLLLLGAYVREWIEVPVSIVGFDNRIDLFRIIAVTDEEGTGSSGYVEEFILILEIEVIPPDPAADRPVTLILKGLNITALADAAWVWGPDSIVSWDTMTAEEKGTYGAWADDVNKIPTLLDPAKEWR
jgi:hypothetical protein